MHDKARLFIQDQEVRVFVKNFQRDRLRLQIKRLRARYFQSDSITRTDFLTRPDWLAIDLNAALPNQPLQGRAGKGRVTIGKKDVDSF